MPHQPHWEAIHHELALTDELLQADLAPHQLSQLLAQRAEQFAVQVHTTTRLEQRHFLILTIGAEVYGIDVQMVQTIVPLQRFTPVPDALPCYVGVANIKGQMISLVHLPYLFGLINTHTSSDAFVIVAKGAGLTLGILADAVQDVLSLRDDQLAQHTSDDPTLVAVLPSGIALLDIEYIFADSRIRSDRGSA